MSIWIGQICARRWRTGRYKLSIYTWLKRHMKYDYLYRYTSDGEGIFSASRRLPPEYLADEVSNAMKWLPEPELPPGDDYRLYFTLKGKEQYEKTLFSL